MTRQEMAEAFCNYPDQLERLAAVVILYSADEMDDAFAQSCSFALWVSVLLPEMSIADARHHWIEYIKRQKADVLTQMEVFA